MYVSQDLLRQRMLSVLQNRRGSKPARAVRHVPAVDDPNVRQNVVCRPGRTCTLLNTYIQYLVSCHRVQGGVRYVMCTHRVGRGGRHDTLGHARMPRPAGIPVAAALAVRPRPTACRCSPTTYACLALHCIDRSSLSLSSVALARSNYMPTPRFL
jgi:hypothetical protein